MVVALRDVNIAARVFRWVCIARSWQGNHHFGQSVCRNNLERWRVATGLECYTHGCVSSDFYLGKGATIQSRIDFLVLLANELEFLIQYQFFHFPRLGMTEINIEIIRIFIIYLYYWYTLFVQTWYFVIC